LLEESPTFIGIKEIFLVVYPYKEPRGAICHTSCLEGRCPYKQKLLAILHSWNA